MAWLARRMMVWLLTIWAAATLTFLLPKISPRDPIEERLSEAIAAGGGATEGLRELAAAHRLRFGLDRPLHEQYLDYLGSLLRFDLGLSITNYPASVAGLILGALPWTIGLLLSATLLAFVAGTLLGALAAWPGTPRAIRAAVPGFMVLAAIPYYLIGLVLIWLLAHQAGLFPIGGGYAIGRVPDFSIGFALEVLHHSVLPALSIVLSSIGIWAVSMRGIMVTVRGEDQVLFAEMRGLRPWRVFLQYGLRNALLPQVTGLGLALGYIVAGAILVEVIFAYPGIGNLLLRAVTYNDYFVIHGVVFVIVVAIATATLLLDIIYPLLDPRIRRGGG